MKRLVFLQAIVISGLTLFAGTAFCAALLQADGQWLKYADGRLHFTAGPGDPEDFLYRNDQQQIIDKLKGTGANSLYFQAVRSHGGDGSNSHNPFIDHDPKNGVDQGVLTKWHRWLKQLSDNEVVSYFFIYDDSARIWTGDAVGSAEKAFLRTLVEKFREIDRLVWVVAEEYAERLSAARVSNIARVIKEYDPHHAVGVHKNVGVSFTEFADDPNIDVFMMQLGSCSASNVKAQVSQAVKAAQGRYVVNMSEAPDCGKGDTLREQAKAAADAGGYFMVYRMDVVGTSTSDLKNLGELARDMETKLNEGVSPNGNRPNNPNGVSLRKTAG
nr:DUF4038 domain-containing protein [Gammaproteobacteria bacterium]